MADFSNLDESKVGKRKQIEDSKGGRQTCRHTIQKSRKIDKDEEDEIKEVM